MKSVYDFIVKPIGERYANTKKIGETNLVLNTKIENWKFVNRLAEVVSTPLAIPTPVKKGDVIVLHQNVFRRFYNMKGKQANSRSYFKDGLYFASVDQVYLYKRNNKWMSLNDRCFVMPLKNKDTLRSQKEQDLIGILKIGNSSLKALNINPGDTVGFTPGSEWDFIIDDQRVYCMKSNDIVIKYEHKRDQEEYNPSWAKSS
jgi:co-chaperonin GroES (HSP10)